MDRIDMSRGYTDAEFNKLVDLIMHDPEFELSVVIKHVTRLYFEHNFADLKDTPLVQKYAKTEPDAGGEEIEEIEDRELLRLIEDIKAGL